MMLYGIIVVILISFLSVLSYLSAKRSIHRRYFIINLSLVLIGLALLISSYLLGLNEIESFDADAELFGWLNDYYSLYYDMAFPVFAILLAVNVISAISCVWEKQPPARVFGIIREISSILSSVLLLLLPYIGLITQNRYVNMYIYMMVSGTGMALIIRLSNMISLLKRNKNL